MTNHSASIRSVPFFSFVGAGARFSQQILADELLRLLDQMYHPNILFQPDDFADFHAAATRALLNKCYLMSVTASGWCRDFRAELCATHAIRDLADPRRAMPGVGGFGLVSRGIPR